MVGGNGCHLFVITGQIQYCGDSRHRLAGRTVPMVDFDVERRCPVNTLHTINGKPVEVKKDSGSEVRSLPPAVTSKTHRPECGDVGDAGEVGDIGSNGIDAK